MLPRKKYAFRFLQKLKKNSLTKGIRSIISFLPRRVMKRSSSVKTRVRGCQPSWQSLNAFSSIFRKAFESGIFPKVRASSKQTRLIDFEALEFDSIFLARVVRKEITYILIISATLFLCQLSHRLVCGAQKIQRLRVGLCKESHQSQARDSASRVLVISESRQCSVAAQRQISEPRRGDPRLT